jgi:hypothetical protein
MERPKFAESVQPEPFYPGTYHTGAGKQFSIGFESANVVQRFSRARMGTSTPQSRNSPSN